MRKVTTKQGLVWRLVGMAAAAVLAFATVGTASSGATANPNSQGRAWTILTSPHISTSVEENLLDVYCLTASNCWAVGDVGANVSERTIAQHWDGKQWSIVPTANTATNASFLSGVWCLAANQCWAVGTGNRNGGAGQTSVTLIERWDGSSWSVVSSPNQLAGGNPADNNLFSVNCTKSSDCWAGGSSKTGNNGGVFEQQTLLEHWDGSSWSIVPSQDQLSGGTIIENVINSLTCTSMANCWAVGEYSAPEPNNASSFIPQTLAEHWDGTTWTIVSTFPNSPGFFSSYDAVRCTSSSDCWAVGGADKNNGVEQTLTEHFDGSTWHRVTSPNRDDISDFQLQGLSCLTSSDCWAVGNGFDGPNSGELTLVEHWNGSNWSIVGSANVAGRPSTSLNATSCSGGATCMGVGNSLIQSSNTVFDQFLIEQAGGGGYWFAASDGGVFNFGSAGFFGSAGSLSLNKPVVGMASTPGGFGYWLAASDGGIFNYGEALFLGSMGGQPLNQPIVGMASTPDGQGYWLVASDGGLFAFGDAKFFGSTGSIALNKPVVGMASTPDGQGYWLVASDGGLFAFGDAKFFGSTGSITLNKPVVGMGSAPDGQGYWLVASDGGLFAFGNARFFGSTGSITLNKPVVAVASTPDGNGYWLVASDGGVFAYGDASFFGSTGAITLNKPVVAASAS